MKMTKINKVIQQL